MERAVVLAGERQVEPARLPLHVQGSPALGINVADGFVASRNRLVREFERQIAKLLEESRSNVSVAAKKARITRRLPIFIDVDSGAPARRDLCAPRLHRGP
jgi:hypothetical protein